MPIINTYPFDPKGTSPTNFIASEVHTLSPQTDAAYASRIIPRYAPYHDSSMVVRHIVNGTPVLLTEGIDYYHVAPVSEAQEVMGIRLNGALMFANRLLAGDVVISYQTIGDRFAENDTNALLSVYRLLYEVTYYTWDMLIGRPSGYVPDYHLHDESEYTMQGVISSLTAILLTLGANSMANGAEAIRPGMVMMLTLNLVDEAAVAAYMGYGTWRRTSVGRYPVGYGQTIDSDGVEFNVGGGRFGHRQIVQTANQVGNHVHPTHLNGPGGDPGRNYAAWILDRTGNYALTSDTGNWNDNLIAIPKLHKFGNLQALAEGALPEDRPPTSPEPMSVIPPSETFYYWERLT